MEVAMEREAPIRLEVPPLPVAGDAIETHSEKWMSLDELETILPDHEPVFGARIGSISCRWNSVALDPVNAREANHDERSEQEPTSFGLDHCNNKGREQQTSERNARERQKDRGADCEETQDQRNPLPQVGT